VQAGAEEKKWNYLFSEMDVEGNITYQLVVRPRKFDCFDLVLYDGQGGHRVHLDRIFVYHGSRICGPGEVNLFAFTIAVDYRCSLLGLHTVADVRLEASGDGIADLYRRVDWFYDRVASGVRTKRSVTRHEWVSLNEQRDERFVWLKPMASAYGFTTLALMGGSDPFHGKEFVELRSYQSAEYVLWLPGMMATGPHYTNDYQSEFIESRSIYRFSSRDVAWVLWNYKKSQPVWVEAALGEEVWAARMPVVPADIPGLVYQVRPLV